MVAPKPTLPWRTVATVGESVWSEPPAIAPAPRAPSASTRLFRIIRRRRLREALTGQPEQIWAYCWERQMTVAQTDLLIYGAVRYGNRVAAERLIRNYSRLCVMARRRKEALR